MMRSKRTLAGVVALAVMSLVVAAAPAGAEVNPDETVGSLVVSSEFAPFVIVKADEQFTLTGTGVVCPQQFEVAQLRVVSLGADDEPNGYVDELIIDPVVMGEPFDFQVEVTLAPEAVQGTYQLVGYCEDIFANLASEDEMPLDEVAGDADAIDAPEAEEAARSLVPEGRLEIEQDVIGALGWIVVGDENRLPPSAGTAEAPAELTIGEEFEVRASGYLPDSETEVWLYSDPVLMGSAAASTLGAVTWQGTMPVGSILGAHTLVVAGASPSGRPLFFTAGTTIGAAVSTTTVPQSPSSDTTAPVAQPTAQGSTAAGATAGASAASGATATGSAATRSSATAATTGGTLPATGLGSSGLAIVALLMLTVGVAATTASRRRLAVVHNRKP